MRQFYRFRVGIENAFGIAADLLLHPFGQFLGLLLLLGLRWLRVDGTDVFEGHVHAKSLLEKEGQHAATVLFLDPFDLGLEVRP